MKNDSRIMFNSPELSGGRSAIEEILRSGAQMMLQQALENEIAGFLEAHSCVTLEDGRQTVVRNGFMPARDIQTGIGPLTIKQPRVRDRAKNVLFTSKILPPFMRRVPSINTLIPILYLKGISTGDMQETLESLLGPQAKGLSAANIVRLKQQWEAEYQAWSARDLSEKEYVYWWVDGIYFNVRLSPERPCILVIMGATAEGKKEIVSVYDGIRESKISWEEVLRDLKHRGLKAGPRLAIGDGALGFWAALEEEFPNTRLQRCWVHKTANILDKMPKSVQPHAKKLIHEMYMAPKRKDALKAYDEFLHIYSAKYPKAVECLVKDKDVLFTFYDYPAQHWMHIRTTNPIESTFATVRHRTRQTKGCGSRLATISMVFKLCLEAEKRWRRLRGSNLIAKVLQWVKFTDGEIEEQAA